MLISTGPSGSKLLARTAASDPCWKRRLRPGWSALRTQRTRSPGVPQEEFLGRDTAGALIIGQRGTPGDRVLCVLKALQPGRKGLFQHGSDAAVRASSLDPDGPVEISIQFDRHLHGPIFLYRRTPVNLTAPRGALSRPRDPFPTAGPVRAAHPLPLPPM